MSIPIWRLIFWWQWFDASIFCKSLTWFIANITSFLAAAISDTTQSAVGTVVGSGLQLSNTGGACPKDKKYGDIPDTLEGAIFIAY